MNFFTKLRDKLKKTSSGLTGGLGQLFGGGTLGEEQLEALEELLLQADVGIESTTNLTAALKKQKFGQDVSEEEVRRFLAEHIAEILAPCESPLALPEALPKNQPAVILMTGVNGSGKTTTIGKLCAQLRAKGTSVLLAAADTFRAGAVQQLDIWAKRTNTPIVTPEKEGADPSGVVFRAYEKAVQEKYDILLIDTAGRLQNRADLMDQLAKMVRVLKKHDAAAPHASVLVLDATVGQNAHQQVEAFKETAHITGLIVTKLDSTAKGGVLVALAEKYKLPVHFIGVGEDLEDLRPFEAAAYAHALVDIPEK